MLRRGAISFAALRRLYYLVRAGPQGGAPVDTRPRFFFFFFSSTHLPKPWRPEVLLVLTESRRAKSESGFAAIRWRRRLPLSLGERCRGEARHTLIALLRATFSPREKGKHPLSPGNGGEVGIAQQCGPSCQDSAFKLARGRRPSRPAVSHSLVAPRSAPDQWKLSFFPSGLR